MSQVSKIPVDRRTPKAQKGGDKGDRDVQIEAAFTSKKKIFLVLSRICRKDVENYRIRQKTARRI
jgi:hypothetical protein